MSNPLQKLEKVLESIDNINFILNTNEIKLTQAIEDKLVKPAIRMNIVRISESDMGRIEVKYTFYFWSSNLLLP